MRRRIGIVATAIIGAALLAAPATAQQMTLGGGLRAQADTVRGYWATASVAPSSGSCLAGTVHVTGSRWAEPLQETAVLAGVTCSASARRRFRPFVQGLVGVSNNPQAEVLDILARIDWRAGIDIRVDQATWVRAGAGVRSLLHPDIGPGLTWSVGLVRTFSLGD